MFSGGQTSVSSTAVVNSTPSRTDEEFSVPRLVASVFESDEESLESPKEDDKSKNQRGEKNSSCTFRGSDLHLARQASSRSAHRAPGSFDHRTVLTRRTSYACTCTKKAICFRDNVATPKSCIYLFVLELCVRHSYDEMSTTLRQDLQVALGPNSSQISMPSLGRISTNATTLRLMSRTIIFLGRHTGQIILSDHRHQSAQR